MEHMKDNTRGINRKDFLGVMLGAALAAPLVARGTGGAHGTAGKPNSALIPKVQEVLQSGDERAIAALARQIHAIHVRIPAM
jgi:hypothetical protein